MPATDQDWARAYAKQALSDLDAHEKLAKANAHKCHRLHFLQMASEKVCKAFLTRHNGHANVRKTHAYVAKHLPRIAREFYLRANGSQMPPWQLNYIETLASEIQVLAPACDDGDVRLDNSEYPWKDGNGNVQVPSEYSFPNIDDGNRTIILLIRLIRMAAEAYVQ